MSSKTVYVLGAGFSCCAGFPLQAQILDRIKSFQVEKLVKAYFDESFDVISHFEPSREKLYEFLYQVFPQDVSPSLEDVFTLLDQTIEARGCCAGFTWEKLEEYRTALKRTILFTFHSASETIEDAPNNFYRSIAAYMVRERLYPGQEKDALSIISLNWDSLLEDSIYWCVNQIDGRWNIDIDYCCYTTPLEESVPHTPSITQKALGIFNIKLMKLHGSANWLCCPNCGRLFTGIGGESSVWDLYATKRACPICTRQQSDLAEDRLLNSLILQPFFVSPTYVKKFDNPHIQMTWHNAFLDLSEATRIIIIGYSLPEADYHVRTLLRRAIRKDAEILVVLTKDAEQKQNTPKTLAGYLPVNRYKDFFGTDRVKFDLNGVEGYFSIILGKQILSRRLSALKGLLTRRLKK